MSGQCPDSAGEIERPHPPLSPPSTQYLERTPPLPPPSPRQGGQVVRGQEAAGPSRSQQSLAIVVFCVLATLAPLVTVKTGIDQPVAVMWHSGCLNTHHL